MDYQYLDTNQGLQEFCQGIHHRQYCALDTEFLREKTYFPFLALIQLATEGELACIDPLGITDFSPLLEILKNKSITKIFHSPSQDLELFYQHFECLPEPIFDTQLASAVLGYGNQISYADLVNKICKVTLEKKYTRTDWSFRPLPEGPLAYAMDDVRYLIDIYKELDYQLEEQGRLEWLKEDFDKLSMPESYIIDLSNLWKRLKGVQHLNSTELNNADQLSRWRENLAIKKNRPRRWIMKDEDIIDIARSNPVTLDDLTKIGNLNRQYINNMGPSLLKALEKASKIAPELYPAQPRINKLTNRQKAIADTLMGICRDVAGQKGLSLAFLTTRKEIDALVTGNSDSRLSSGWRNKMVGEKLENFLRGNIHMGCEEGHLKYEKE